MAGKSRTTSCTAWAQQKALKPGTPFEVEPDGDGALIRQTAIFDPIGLAGLVYWYATSPVHLLVCSGMLREIAAAAQATGSSSGAAPKAARRP